MQQSQKKSKQLEQSKIQPLHNTIMCLEQNIILPSNLLQKRKNILNQYRQMRTSQNSRLATPRELPLMNKTFSHSRKDQIPQEKLEMLIEEKGKKQTKSNHNPLYKRLCNIQAETKELAGVSFSKLLSRMLIIQGDEGERKEYTSKRNNQMIESKLRSIPNYECLQSKVFTLECPQTSHPTSSKTSPNQRPLLSSPPKSSLPTTNRLFRRYYNPHGQKSQPAYQTIEFDERYIYKNGRKAECKRIHNFYTSQMFRKSYEKHVKQSIDERSMRHTIDGFWGGK